MSSSPPAPARFEITVDGTPIQARAGQTLAAVLLAHRHRAWRSTRQAGQPRGLFCGIGICYDCLATVNDVPNVRACLAEAQPGDEVRTQEGTGHDARAC